MKKKTVDINTKIDKLPQEIMRYLTATKGIEITEKLADDFGLYSLRILIITRILTNVFVGDVKVEEVPQLLKDQIKIDSEVVSKLAIELLGRRLLVADDYFQGKVSALIKKLGGDPESFRAKYVDEYKKQVEQEFAPPIEKTEKVTAPVVEEEKIFEPGEMEVGDPEVELEEMKGIMRKYATTVLTTDNLIDRADFNAIIIALLLSGRGIQPELINELTRNQELISKKKINHRGEMLEPTVANWLKNFYSSAELVGEDKRISTVSKAKYFSENENVKALETGEKLLLSRVIDLFINLKNFYENKQRMALGDIQIFPFSQEEIEEFMKKYGDHLQSGVEQMVEKHEKERDIYDVYAGDPKEQQELEQAEKMINQQVGLEKGKLRDWLYDQIIARHKVNIVAGLMYAIKIGVLDDFVWRDNRYIELLEAYYKRNNLTKELNAYKIDRHDPVHVKNMIRYLLMERLGMNENNAGRYAMQFSSLYRTQGIKELSQMAYFDVAKKQFKWL